MHLLATWKILPVYRLKIAVALSPSVSLPKSLAFDRLLPSSTRPDEPRSLVEDSVSMFCLEPCEVGKDASASKGRRTWSTELVWRLIRPSSSDMTFPLLGFDGPASKPVSRNAWEPVKGSQIAPSSPVTTVPGSSAARCRHLAVSILCL